VTSYEHISITIYGVDLPSHATAVAGGSVVTVVAVEIKLTVLVVCNCYRNSVAAEDISSMECVRRADVACSRRCRVAGGWTSPHCGGAGCVVSLQPNVPPYVAGHPASWDTLANFYYNKVNNGREAQVVSG
jgi:hypothetical protein